MTLKKTSLWLLLALLWLLMPSAAPLQAQSSDSNPDSGGARLAFSAFRNGQWDIYSITPTGTDLRQVTNTPFVDTDPAYAPNGQQLAYASRRNNNWDIYLLDLKSGVETRLTTSPHYDGAPAWHPNGEQLAYESFAAGDLDIWQVTPGSNIAPQNLTSDSQAGDFAPAFSPTGDALAFTSWRNGDQDLFLLALDSGQTEQLTNSPAAESQPTWHPNGKTIAFVYDDLGDREIYSLSPATPPVEDGPLTHITWLGRTDNPTYSPTGDALAALFHRWDGQQLMLTPTGDSHRLPHEVTDIIAGQGRISWHSEPVNAGLPLITLTSSHIQSLYEETLTPNDDPVAEPYNLIRQNNIDTGTPWLADTVDESFQAWRQRLQAEVGYDFLSQLSDATRDVGSYTETSQYASWHKSGRAIDTLFDYHYNGQLMHEIVKEDYGGETYWRIYLRCLAQDGSCGRPLTATPWNYSRRARVEIAPEQGGIEKSNISGYYVDMTALAREYGWERISSYDDEEFSWTWNFIAFEYWHYQKRLQAGDAANWYQAMQDVYPPATLERFFSWQKMRQLDEDPHLIALKGVPLPLSERPWWALVR